MSGITENIVVVDHKPAKELVSGDILVGDMGGQTMVIDASPSSSHPGFIIVATEFGYLFLDDDEEELVAFVEG
jgi:hypothetical protein